MSQPSQRTNIWSYYYGRWREYSDRSQRLNRLTGYFRYKALWEKYRDRSMSPHKTFIGNLATVDNHRKRHDLSDGCLVECGTWRGGMAFALAELCTEIQECHFFDSFEGLPPAGEWDGDKAHQNQADGVMWHNNNVAPLDDFRNGMQPLETGNRSLEAHKGWFTETLPEFKGEREIAILRIDANWYDSTICVLENLYDKVMFNGLILLDDYYDWDGCSRAVHDFLSDRKLRVRVRQSRYGGIPYIVKENIDV